jgi:hypothetical protein
MTILFSINNLSCQNKDLYVKSKEIIVNKNPNFKLITNNKRLDIVGAINDEYVILGMDSLKNKKTFLYNENKQEIKPLALMPNQKENKVIRIKVKNDLILQIGYLGLSEEYYNIPFDKLPIHLFEYQEFWIQFKNRNVKIDSYPYYYLDKYINCNFSDVGDKLVCNPYTTFSAGYSPDDDNRIYLYDLHGIENGKFVKQIIPCERCVNTFIIKNKFIYGKEIPIGKGYDGYYLNIYSAPIDNINDTVLIAHDIEIKQITPDGKFILGKKYLYGKYTPVIVNVDTKRYQYILGRNYFFDYCYYSHLEEKFAFDIGEKIVYIEFPKDYPFDALENIFLKHTTKEENRIFWEKYWHNP